MDLDEWLHGHTFSYRDFWDLKRLVACKEEQGLRISLCIPTLNEEQTIAKEVIIFHSELKQRYPLLDEIAVIDSGSDDRTLEVAAAFGADTYLATDILPEVGPKQGKGENLWKAIYQLEGDIIVYVDADIKNIHPRFVYGLVAPLIYRPAIKYVKAFYDRPLVVSSGLRMAGGGRVTEILVRPLFSLFFPELTGLIQPLSGEYAVRREVLQEIAFPIGYGVETSHLIDVYSRWGMSAFGQTDLGQRVHTNQPTRALGRMSFGILQTFLSRMRALGMVDRLPELNRVLRQFQVKETNYEIVEYHLVEDERPPMLTIPAYRRKIGLDGG